MRIVSRTTLLKFWQKHHDAENPLKAWFDEAKNAKWNSPQDVKRQYRNTSIITNKRVVFNISGNNHRLVVDIEYKIGIILIIWIGTHKDYDKINVRDIKYVKTN